MRIIYVLFVAAMALAACAPPPPSSGADGRQQTIYRIRSGDTAKLQFRMLDSVNALRAAEGVPSVELNSQLNAAAETHARDMSVQDRAWTYGSDGSFTIQRAARAGYPGTVRENVSETYEGELETLGAWMMQADTRRTILSPDARDMGFAWYQEPNGKIWWSLVMGDPNQTPSIPSANPTATRLVPRSVDNPTPDTPEPNT